MAFWMPPVDDGTANQLNVECDGYTLRFHTDEESAYGIVAISSTSKESRLEHIVNVGGTQYYFCRDSARVYSILEDTPFRKTISVKGNFDSATGSDSYLTNSDSVEVTYYIYPNHIYIDLVWITSTANITLTSNDWFLFDFDHNGTNNKQNIYENSGAESNASNDTWYADANYIGYYSDEIHTIVIPVYDSYSGAASYAPRSDKADEFGLHLYGDTITPGTHRFVASVLWDFRERENDGGTFNAWATSQSYTRGQILLHTDNERYLVLEDHTSGTHATDLSNGKITEYRIALAAAAKDIGIYADTKPSTTDQELQTEHPLASDFVIFLPLNEGIGTPSDLSSQGQTINLSSPAPTWIGSDPATGMEFDGSNNDYIQISDDNSLDMPNAFTCIVSLHTDVSNDTNFHSILTKNDTYKFYLKDTGVLGIYNDDAGAFVLNGTTVLSVDTDYVLAFVYTGSNLYIYIDGDEEATTSYSTSFGTTGTDIFIGYNNAGGSEQRWDGQIYVVGLADRGLSAKEVKDLSEYLYSLATKPDEGKFVRNLNSPLQLQSYEFASDGAFQVEYETSKPDEDNDDLKTAPDIDGSGAIEQGGVLDFVINEGSGNLTDLINSHTGTLQGSASWSVESAPWNHAIELDGSTQDYVNVPDHADLNHGGNDLSLEAVFLWDGTHSTGNYAAAAGKVQWNGVDYREYWLEIESSGSTFTLRFVVSSDGTEGNTTSVQETSLAANTIYHAVGVYDGSNLKLYLNGIEVATTSYSSGIHQGTAPFKIGLLDDNASDHRQYLNGKVYKVKLYHHALAANEVFHKSRNPFYSYGDRYQIHVPNDILRLPVVVADIPRVWTGPADNPVEHTAAIYNFDDNTASATITDEFGFNDGTWRVISGGASRNTNNDSVADSVRGRALDTQALYYADFPVGSGSLGSNDLFKEGAVEFVFKPQYAYTVSGNPTHFLIYIDANNYIALYYNATNDYFELQIIYGGTTTNVSMSDAFTSNDELQDYVKLTAGWSNTYDFAYLAFNGKVVDVAYGLGTPSSSQPTDFILGVWEAGTTPADIYIDKLIVYKDLYLPYGAHFTQNEGDADYSKALKNILCFVKGDETSGTLKIPGSGTISTVATATDTDFFGNASSAIKIDANADDFNFTCTDGTQIDKDKGSISFWYKEVDAVTTSAHFFRHSSAADAFRAYRDASDTAIDFVINGTTHAFTGLTNVFDGNWHYIKFTWDCDDDVFKIFIDGIEEDSSTTATTAPALSSGSLRIGASGSDNIEGLIHDITITDDPNSLEIPVIAGAGPEFIPEVIID